MLATLVVSADLITIPKDPKGFISERFKLGKCFCLWIVAWHDHVAKENHCLPPQVLALRLPGPTSECFTSHQSHTDQPIAAENEDVGPHWFKAMASHYILEGRVTREFC